MPDTDSLLRENSAAEPAVGHAPASEIVRAELAEPRPPVRYRRRATVPIVLFLLTCASTFFAGATGWLPGDYLLRGDPDVLGPYFQLSTRLAILEHWQQGLIYMGCVLAILLLHEMGHFVM